MVGDAHPVGLLHAPQLSQGLSHLLVDNIKDDAMMRNQSTSGRAQVRERCRKGIPPSIRARAWLHLCGAKYQVRFFKMGNYHRHHDRWRILRIGKRFVVFGAAVDASRGGSTTLRRISTGERVVRFPNPPALASCHHWIVEF